MHSQTLEWQLMKGYLMLPSINEVILMSGSFRPPKVLEYHLAIMIIHNQSRVFLVLTINAKRV